MKDIWLAIDVNYLCWRAFYTTGELTNGVAFGFLKELSRLVDRFDPTNIVFCFDRGTSLRKIGYPQYKANRKDLPYETRKRVKSQITKLRKELLPELGFTNILSQKGFESDDLIAEVTLKHTHINNIIIVSADKDLLQLLSPTVCMYRPQQKSVITADSFSEQYGVSPSQWADVKAISGCLSDNIDGIDGVGDITACKFLSGKLKATSIAFQKIIKGNKLWKKNLLLTRLPFPGLQEFTINENERLNSRKWEKLTERLDMNSIKSDRKRKGGFGIAQQNRIPSKTKSNRSD